jgi:hypothetical protein
VQWGSSPSTLTRAAPSAAVTYTAAMMCGAPANGSGWLHPGWAHHAVLAEAPAPGQRVHYRFGSDATGWSSIFSFMAGPAAGSPTRFLVFNDVGQPQPILFDNICPPHCPAGLQWDGGWHSSGWRLARFATSTEGEPGSSLAAAKLCSLPHFTPTTSTPPPPLLPSGLRGQLFKAVAAHLQRGC